MKLQDVCELFTDGDWIESKDQSDSGIRLVQTGNIGIGKYLEKEGREKYISFDTFKELNCTEIYPGDVLISRLPDPVGRGCIIPDKQERMITAVDCTICRVNEEIVDRRYFCYYLRSSAYYNQLEQNVAGTTRKRISRKNLGNVEIHIPEMEKQIYVISVLDKISAVIEARPEELQQLEELIKARFVELFGDMLLNDRGWKESILEEIADLVSGITKGRKVKDTELIEVPYMAVSNVKDGYIDWTTVKTIFATKNEIDQYRLLPNDVLMTEGGDPDKVGRGAIIREPMENSIHQNHIFRVRLDREIILPEYFSEYLQHQKAKRYFLRCAKQTTGIASINMKQLRSLPVLTPPMELQQQFATFVEQTDKSKVAVQKALDEAQLLFDSLMQKYFG